MSNADVNVISPEELEERLNRAKSPTPSQEIAGKFSKMSIQISKGVEKFFYESEKKSIDNLQPVFDLGMNNISALARRADYADQIFQAGILLIRAYEIRNKKEQAESVVQLIVENFPTQPFSASVIPPAVITRLENARKALGKSGTTLELINRESSSQCVAYLNGFAAPINDPIFAKAETTYHLRLDCGVENQVVWQTQLKKGEKSSVPLTAGNPLVIGISANDLKARQKTEIALRAVMFWASIDHIVGVSENLKKGANVLVVRIQGDKDAKWSDGAKREDVNKALVRVFPELEIEVDDSSQIGLSDSKDGPDWIGWTFVGSGIVAAGVGVGLWVSTLDTQRELECGYGNRTDCDGVPVRDPNSSDFQADQDAVDTRVIGSYVLYSVGGLLTAYGIYRLVTYEPQKTGLSFSPVLSPNNVGFQLNTRF